MRPGSQGQNANPFLSFWVTYQRRLGFLWMAGNQPRRFFLFCMCISLTFNHQLVIQNQLSVQKKGYSESSCQKKATGKPFHCLQRNSHILKKTKLWRTMVTQIFSYLLFVFIYTRRNWKCQLHEKCLDVFTRDQVTADPLQYCCVLLSILIDFLIRSSGQFQIFFGFPVFLVGFLRFVQRFQQYWL